MAELIAILGLVVVALITIRAVWWVVRRLASPVHDPDRTEAQLRAELDAEADRHDLDGLAINWDDEMRRRGL